MTGIPRHRMQTRYDGIPPETDAERAAKSDNRKSQKPVSRNGDDNAPAKESSNAV